MRFCLRQKRKWGKTSMQYYFQRSLFLSDKFPCYLGDPLFGTINSPVHLVQDLHLILLLYFFLQKFRKNYKWKPFAGFGILLPKLFWPTVRKNRSSGREKLLKFKAEGGEFAYLRSLRTIYSDSERSVQFLVTKCFFNLFLNVSQM